MIQVLILMMFYGYLLFYASNMLSEGKAARQIDRYSRPAAPDQPALAPPAAAPASARPASARLAGAPALRACALRHSWAGALWSAESTCGGAPELSPCASPGRA